ncbi:MAG: DUF2326 domain-containing protein [Methanobacteriaceae archaeon]|nr:DUF2326 domain-containing protein [Methanobacteriaceae archaeon]
MKRLYSEPEGLFPVINFKNGVNFIFAKKEKDTDTKKSLNGVGKTLLLDLLDYCLLSSETKLIKSAKVNNNLKESIVILEFVVDGKNYIIKRSFAEPNKNILFGTKNSPSNYNSIDDVKEILCDLIFKNTDYKGKYSNKWLRKLIPFFIKKQSTKYDSFSDPIKYIKEVSEAELVQYHLLLMNIDNTFFYQNNNLQSEFKKKRPAIREVRDLVQDTYGLRDISHAESEIDKLHVQVGKLEGNIKQFKLADQYEDVEKQSNQLTLQIKDLWFQNFSDRKKVESYRDSFHLNDDLSVRKVGRMYKELNELLAEKIEKTLEEAITFRKQIAQSRKDFLKTEINDLEDGTKKREVKIKELEERRAELFRFLEAKNAISDLSEAYLELSKKREEVNDLSGKIKLYQDLKKEEADLKQEEAKLYAEIVSFIQKIQKSLSEFRQEFFNVHDAIYMENKDRSSFSLTANEKKDSKINIDVSLPADLSKGKNQGRTLIYDLAILFHAIKKGVHAPRFLVHDGIFDGMDKAHFVHLYEYLEKLSNSGTKFQYLITLNEEGTLNENFGNTEKVTPEKIAEEAIITLTPTKLLFGNKWD